jgi:predicted metal-dependent hydrolase
MCRAMFLHSLIFTRVITSCLQSLANVDALIKAWQQRNSMNWLRSAIVLAGLVFSFVSLHKVYTVK